MRKKVSQNNFVSNKSKGITNTRVSQLIVLIMFLFNLEVPAKEEGEITPSDDKEEVVSISSTETQNIKVEAREEEGIIIISSDDEESEEEEVFPPSDVFMGYPSHEGEGDV